MYKYDMKFTKHMFEWVFHRLVSTIDGTRRLLLDFFRSVSGQKNAYECQIASLPPPRQRLSAPASRAKQHYHLVAQPSLEVASHQNLTDQTLFSLMSHLGIPRRH